MMCAWEELLSILPSWMRKNVDNCGRDTLQEVRIRINAPPELILKQQRKILQKTASGDDLSFCVNMASRYSPWAAGTISQGYITASGGHRIGICGEVIYKGGRIEGIKNIRSVCIRVARDIPGFSSKINLDAKSILIIGAPGWGKTTLLRDLIRRIGEKETVCVIDERNELFPQQMGVCQRIDVMTGCAKAAGMDMVVRTMAPDRVALDEITASEDAEALLHAVGCGVGILATAHASSLGDLQRRPIYRKIWENHIFDTVIVMHPDKSYHEERIRLCV